MHIIVLYIIRIEVFGFQYIYVLSVFIGHVLVMVLKISDKNRIAYLKLPEKCDYTCSK